MNRGVARALTILLVLSGPAATRIALAQDSKELGRLRDFLSLPASAVVSETDEGGLPVARPLKVYLATDDEPTAPAEVVRFVGEHDTQAPGEIEIVSSIAAADVVLVQFEVREKRRIELDNRLTMDPTLSSRTSGGRSDPVYRSEIRGYVLVHKVDSYTIVEKYKRSVTLGGKRTELRAAFERTWKRGHGS